MASNLRKKVVASRRRREDEGEEEGSVLGEMEDDSLSEGSIISHGDDDADIEPSDISEDDISKTQSNEHGVALDIANLASTGKEEAPNPQATDSKFTISSDTKAMMNGLKLTDTKHVPEVDFDEVTVDATDSAVEDSRPQAKTPRETPAERSRREHLEYLRQQNENPAFVPNRGGFFLHDNRAAPGQNGFRGSAKGRGRGGFNGFHSRIPPLTEPTDRPWAHDLHDSVSTADTRKPNTSQVLTHNVPAKASTTVAPPSQAPNRSFSTFILLGKVPVIIHLPGMEEKITVQNVAKKKHTLLPQHRPPLRRDKPVRISLPNHQPRYIFPSMERSFIFIPRALRPNQQGFGRGRGRYSLNPSRRTSVYGASTYTTSAAMSRRSSLGPILPGDGVRSPGGSALPLPPGYVTEPGKPVVRFPPAPRPMAVMPPPGTDHINGAPNTSLPIRPALQSQERQENVPNALTMHQPRPQKTISVADIESPARLHFNPPLQQQEQPFHQQMPMPVSSQVYSDEATGYNTRVRRLSHASGPAGTPLSQIPERAIYAQPFQPFPLPPQVHGYVPAPYPAGAIFYPAMQGEVTGYGPGIGPSAVAPAFYAAPPPAYMVPPAPVPAATPTDSNVPAGTVAHESNGMVYYYDSSQFPPSTGAPYAGPYTGAPIGGVVGMGGMMTPPNQFFYPPTNNGPYYAPR